MSTLLFVALVSGGPAEGYLASFPDFPESSCRGADIAGLLLSARTTIMSSLQALSDAGEAWPTPTPIDELGASPGRIALLVDVGVDDPPVRVNISLGERLLARLDAAAEARSMTRSGFITHAVRISLGEHASPNAEFDAVGRRIQDELGALGRRINDSIGPESPFTRRMTELDDLVYDGVRKAADSVSAAMARRRSAAKPNGAHPSDVATPEPYKGPEPYKEPEPYKGDDDATV